jgi:hypothetical protein
MGSGPTTLALEAKEPTEDPFPEPEKPGFFDLIGRIRYAISQWFSNLVTSALRPVFDFLGRTVFSTPQIAINERIMKRSKPSTLNSATRSGPCPISNLPTEAHLSHRSPAGDPASSEPRLRRPPGNPPRRGRSV